MMDSRVGSMVGGWALRQVPYMEEWRMRLCRYSNVVYTSADHRLTLWDDGQLQVFTCIDGYVPCDIMCEIHVRRDTDDLLRILIQYSSYPLV
jgi:hypothetical protein